MSKFRVGDRVKVIAPGLESTGKAGTIMGKKIFGSVLNELTGVRSPRRWDWPVMIDGWESDHSTRCYFYGDADLAPLTNPDTEAWKAFKELLKPNPAILKAKDPAKKQEFWVTP